VAGVLGAGTVVIPRLVSAGLGVWLLAAPDVLGYGDVASTVHRVAGAVVASVAIMAIWEVLRALRWVNAVFGAGLVVAALVLDAPAAARAGGLLAGLGIVALACVRGPLRASYGGGWRMLVARRGRA
jgi:hypothetical protein